MLDDAHEFVECFLWTKVSNNEWFEVIVDS